MPERVLLRPVTADDVAVLEQLTQDPEITGEFEWSGWYDLRSLQRGWDDNGLIGPDGGILMVIRDDEPLGAVNWRRHETTPGAHCWEVGIELVPEARGHGYGTEAHRLLVRYLFAHTTVHRIEAVTEVGNVGERRALEKTGFTREGVMRGSGWRDGAWRDSLLYSILRTDPLP
jgi:RimJ/RimL family protein N-acetyltransferase